MDRYSGDVRAGRVSDHKSEDTTLYGRGYKRSWTSLTEEYGLGLGGPGAGNGRPVVPIDGTRSKNLT